MYKRYRILVPKVLLAILLAALLVALAACSPKAEEQAAAPNPNPGPTPAPNPAPNPAPTPTPTVEEPAARAVTQDWRSDRQALGQATYDKACASCHAAGELDAPRAGVREDWSERSDLWQAVLFSHAKSGYLEMPGKGGQPELTDEAVEAAVEYMLGLTFPELPRD
ncbi:MAG: c-type cytochrome [Lysobacterales bacterium]